MGLGIADKEISRKMQDIGKEITDRLKDITGEDTGFSLIVFNREPESRLNYVSNCDREQVVEALTALLEGWGKGMPDIPAHEVN